MNQSSGRVDRLRSFVDRDPENVDLSIDLIRTAAAEQGIPAALAIEATLSRTVVEHPAFANAVGVLLLEAGDAAGAEPYLRRVDDAVRGNPSVNYNLAFALFQQHRFPEALAEIENAIEDWQRCTPLMLLKARCLHQVEDYEAAAEAARRFLDEHPDHLEASGLLSLILADSGRYEESLELSRKVLDDRPEQLEALLANANCSIAEGDYPAAGTSLEAARDRYPGIGRIQVLDGELHLLRAEHDQALESFRAATELMPQHLGSWHLLGWCQLLLNDVGAAKQSFESALEVDRNFAESHGGMAVASFIEGNYDRAREYTERALRLNRHSLSGLYAQSLLDERAGQPGQAARIIDKIFKTPVGQRAQQLMPVIAAHRAEREKESADDGR